MSNIPRLPPPTNKKNIMNWGASNTTVAIPLTNARREDAAAEALAVRELSAAIGGRTRAPTQQLIIKYEDQFATLVVYWSVGSVGTAATHETIPPHRFVWLTASTWPDNEFAASVHAPRRQPSRAVGQS